MIIIGFCNLKGGVGKTTACQNIAVALAKTGRKVAVIDMDPQSNLSAGFGVTPGSTDPQVFDLLTDEAKWDDIVKQKEGVDIIPSSLNLTMAELNNSGLLENDSLLREAVQAISPDRYDYVFIDSPPQLGIFTRNVLAACDKIIVPMDGGYYSLFGFKLLEEALPVLRERVGNNVEVLGILMTNHNPRFSIAQTIFNEIKKSYADILFESYISQSVGLIEASSMGMSIFEYSPSSKAAQCYKDVAKELIKRVEGKDSEVKISKGKSRGRPKKVSEKKEEIKTETPKPEVTEPAPIIATDTVTEPKPIAKPDDDILEILTPTPAPQPLEGIEVIVTPPDIVEIPTVQEPKPSEPITPPEQPEPKPEPPLPPKKPKGYEDKIKQDLIDLLPERQQQIWSQILAPIEDVSRGEINIEELREDFSNSDNYRYTFYILTDENNRLEAVSFPDQIADPLRCVVKLDEHGAAEIFF